MPTSQIPVAAHTERTVEELTNEYPVEDHELGSCYFTVGTADSRIDVNWTQVILHARGQGYFVDDIENTMNTIRVRFTLGV